MIKFVLSILPSNRKSITEYHSNLLMVKLVSACCLLCFCREMGMKSIHFW